MVSSLCWRSRSFSSYPLNPIGNLRHTSVVSQLLLFCSAEFNMITRGPIMWNILLEIAHLIVAFRMWRSVLNSNASIVWNVLLAIGALFATYALLEIAALSVVICFFGSLFIEHRIEELRQENFLAAAFPVILKRSFIGFRFLGTNPWHHNFPCFLV